ncbi:hypothetical protein QE152_g19803 [Popillia japonica]|uniref:BPL/LPL catalytic domain-containing protein n=1 Tax=Popillia japonica TaxID=7064 RepID=A0AAW1KNZ4_POPJA
MLKNRHILLLTHNDPCVLIGNNQNPWVESNVHQLKNISKKGTRLARRIGEGPAVYQDEGNLNLTFFTKKNSFNTGYNMEVVKRALFRQFNLKTKLTSGKDIMLRTKKVTDNASFVGEENAYQQCSLLVNVNKADLLEALKTESPVKPKDTFKHMNLVDENYHVTIKDVISAIGWEYLRTTPFSVKDGGKELASLQGGFHYVNPTNGWFPGLQQIRDEFSNWDWTFGKTPNFTLNRSFPVPRHLMKDIDVMRPEINITMFVENARIKDVTMFVPPGLSQSGFSGEIKVLTNLKGRKFTEDALKSLEDYCKNAASANDKDRIVAICNLYAFK